MTVGAAAVPVLFEPRPMQRVAEVDLLVRVQREPALAAAVPGARIPRNRQRLHPSPGKLDQVLLQRVDAERVLDLEIGELAIGAVGAYEVLAVAPEERRRHAAIREGRAIEAAEDRGIGCVLHRLCVLRGLPCVGLGTMALGAGRLADVRGGRQRHRCLRDRGSRWWRGPRPIQRDEHRDGDEGDKGNCEQRPPAAHGRRWRRGRNRAVCGFGVAATGHATAAWVRSAIVTERSSRRYRRRLDLGEDPEATDRGTHEHSRPAGSSCAHPTRHDDCAAVINA